MTDILENGNCVTTYVDDLFTTCIGITSSLKVELMQQFEKVYKNLSAIYSDKEPLINMITWYGLDKISHFGGDEVEVWIVREEDMDKLNAQQLTEIYKEISLSPQQLNTLCDQLFKKE